MCASCHTHASHFVASTGWLAAGHPGGGSSVTLLSCSGPQAMGEGDAMSDTNQTEYRFAQDVALTAPKPGFHLATISFQVRNEVTILWVIEGPQNDEIGIVGNRT